MVEANVKNGSPRHVSINEKNSCNTVIRIALIITSMTLKTLSTFRKVTPSRLNFFVVALILCAKDLRYIKYD